MFSKLELDLILYSAMSFANEDPLSSSNFVGESYSSIRPAYSTKLLRSGLLIRQAQGSTKLLHKPCSRTRTMSLSSTEVIRCAIIITVESVKCFWSVCWIFPSVAVSTHAPVFSILRDYIIHSKTNKLR